MVVSRVYSGDNPVLDDDKRETLSYLSSIEAVKNSIHRFPFHRSLVILVIKKTLTELSGFVVVQEERMLYFVSDKPQRGTHMENGRDALYPSAMCRHGVPVI